MGQDRQIRWYLSSKRHFITCRKTVLFLRLSSFPLPLLQELNLETASFKQFWILTKYFRETCWKTLINTNLTDSTVNLYFGWTPTTVTEIFLILLK
jgi:hypothetical protein